MSILKHLTPGFLRNRYLNLQKRLQDLEGTVRRLDMAVDALVVSPKYTPGDDVGFNGQRQRKRIFSEATAAIPFDAILETGTWLGNTTGYMAGTAKRPVYSCEVSPRFHALARMRLAGLEGIQLELKDSRRFLEEKSRSPMTGQCVWFYLDAHWYDDLPLAEEMELIGSRWSRYVVMIDDFKVPDDPGYGYDDYGAGKALALDLLQPAIAKHRLAVFFPSASSQEETGGRCGCVVLAPRGELSEKLSRLASLREWRDPRNPS